MQSRENHSKENNISDEIKLQKLSKLTIFYTKRCISKRISYACMRKPNLTTISNSCLL